MNIEQINADTSNVPIVRLATPLFNPKNEKKGILTLDLHFSKVLELLPENMFIQTEEGNILSLRPDGYIAFNKSHYVFKDNSGWLHLSEVETIHYTNVGLTERRYPDIVDAFLKIEMGSQRYATLNKFANYI